MGFNLVIINDLSSTLEVQKISKTNLEFKTSVMVT